MAETTKIALIGTLTIPNGTQNSNELERNRYANYAALSIFAPATLPETVNLQSADADINGANFNIVRSQATDVVLAAGRTDVVGLLPFPRIRLRATANVGADRVFQVWGVKATVSTAY